MLFEGLGGRVLDAGVGTGRNMPFYPENAEIAGIDLSPAMLRRAEARRARTGIRVELLTADVTARIPFPDAHFDAVVASFLFCVLELDQQIPALNEIARVLRPGGEARLLEYVLPTRSFRRTVARLWAPWIRWAYGASFDRNTEQYLEASRLEKVESRYVYDELIKRIVARPRG